MAVVALSIGSAVAANASATKSDAAKPNMQVVKAKTHLQIVPPSRACDKRPDTSAGSHWMCSVKPSVARQLLAAVPAAARPPVAAAAVAAADQYCDGDNNCWVRSTSSSGLFNGGLEEFGYDDEVLGYTVENEAWTLSGTKTSVKASLYVYDDDVQFIVWDGYLGNSAPGDAPYQLKTCSQKDGAEEVEADTHVDSPSGWCTLSDNANYNHYINVQVSFQTSADGDTGFWYTAASSIVAHSATLPATSYSFDGPSSRPNPATFTGYVG
jgi:hypothetical protein